MRRGDTTPPTPKSKALKATRVTRDMPSYFQILCEREREEREKEDLARAALAFELMESTEVESAVSETLESFDPTATLNPRMGILYPCHGEYECLCCRRVWRSSKAWILWGQKCKSCAKKIKVHNASELYHYICKKCKTPFQTKFVREGLPCHNCDDGTLVFPISHSEYIKPRFVIVGGRKISIKKSLETIYNLRKAAKEKDREEYKLLHRSDLCEDCQAYGRDCWDLDEDGPHLENLCQKCVRYEKPCWTVGFGENYRDYLKYTELDPSAPDAPTKLVTK